MQPFTDWAGYRVSLVLISFAWLPGVGRRAREAACRSRRSGLDRTGHAACFAEGVPGNDGRRRGRRSRRREERRLRLPHRQLGEGSVVAGRPGQVLPAGPCRDLQPHTTTAAPRTRRLKSSWGSGRWPLSPRLPARRHGFFRREGQQAAGRVASGCRGARGSSPGPGAVFVRPGRSRSLRGRRPPKNIALGRPADQKSAGSCSVSKHPVPPRRRILAGPHARRTCRGRAGARLAPSADAARLAPLVRELDALESRLTAVSAASEPFRRRTASSTSRRVRSGAQDRLCQPAAGLRQAPVHQAARLGRRLSTCATSTTAATPCPAAACSCSRIPSGRHPKLVEPAGPRDGRERAAAGAEARRRGVPLARGLLRRPHDPLRLQRGEGLRQDQGKETYLWGPEIQLSPLQGQRRRHRPGAADRRRVQRLRSLLPARRPDRLRLERRGGYLRCGRHCPVYTLYSMEPDGSDIDLPELPRDARVASERDQRRHARLHAVGLRGPRHEHRPPHLDLLPRRPRSAVLPRQLPGAAGKPAVDGDGHPGDPRLAEVRGHDRRPTTGTPSARWC